MVLPLSQPGWWSVYGPSSRLTWVSRALPPDQPGWVGPFLQINLGDCSVYGSFSRSTWVMVGLRPFLQVNLGESGPPCRSSWVIGRFTALPPGHPGWAGSSLQVNLGDRSVYGPSSRSSWVSRVLVNLCDWSVYGPSSRSSWVSRVLLAGQPGWLVGLRPFL